jgi:hypothetical protein
MQKSAVVETPLDGAAVLDGDVHRAELNIADLDHDVGGGIFCAASRNARCCDGKAEAGDPPPHY